jgi:RimJ/RimL family protein N-acetyltransferase
MRLRPIRLDDVDHIMEWINEPDVTRNFADMSKEITREHELAFLSQMIASDTDRLFAIEDDDGGYLGNAGIHKIYWPAKNGRVGLVIGRRGAHGKGHGQRALQLLCAEAFDNLGLHKLWLVHFVANARMHHIATKHGFVVEGTLRDEYFHLGGYHDMVRMSLLEGEYAARTRQS